MILAFTYCPVRENICFFRSNMISSLVFAGSCHGTQILDLNSLQSVPPSHISGGPKGSSHMFTNKCILMCLYYHSSVQDVWWEAPHLLIPLNPHYFGQWPPVLATASRNSISTFFEGHGRPPVSLGVPEVFKLQGTAKWPGMSFLWLLSCRRTQ